jgi:hypothetical protein
MDVSFTADFGYPAAVMECVPASPGDTLPARSAGTPTAVFAGPPAPVTLPLDWFRLAALALTGIVPAAANTPIAHPKPMTATAVRRINTPVDD